MSSIKIYDNFLDEYDATNLERIFCDESGIPWHYQSTVVSDYDDEDINISNANSSSVVSLELESIKRFL